jgi:RNA polymerase sigma-70 factor (ECF subfamily)
MLEKSYNIEKRFLESYDLYSDAIFRYISFRVSEHDLSIEFVQDVFMKTWKYLSEGKEISNLKSFLYQIAHNIVIDHYRKRKPESSLDILEEDSGFEPGVDETQSMMDKIDGEEALKLLDRLPEIYKEVIFMKYVEELTLSEISEIVGETENTIAVRIHRGIGKLRKLYEE